MSRLRRADYVRSTRLKIVGESKKYKHVRIVSDSTMREFWQTNCMNELKEFMTEREAAIEVDKILIKSGKEPVNILKAKK